MIELIQPSVFIIFGGTGDLAWRKLIPALFNLHRAGILHDRTVIFALGSSQADEGTLREHLYEGVKQFARPASLDDWTAFVLRIKYQRGDLMDIKTYERLGMALSDLDREWNAQAQRIFYLAVPPSMFGEIPQKLSEAGLVDHERTRLVVEKPFGCDLESARDLNRILTRSFDESQIFRIDHYLGKETVQNILAFRFANPIFEPLWNRNYIDHVAITVAEQVGVEHRGRYYEKAGALRDMIQNHLMQLLSLIAMEPPVSFAADEIRNKKVDALRSIRPIAREDVSKFAVRGQYGAGEVKGERVCGYREEPAVAAESGTETFAALQLSLDNWRWHDVPFYLRTGKRLPVRASEIVIRFCGVPHRAFPPEAAVDFQPVRLILSIQPFEGIVLKFHAKQPGTNMHLRSVDMRFAYRETFDDPSPKAYETLLRDILLNDPTQFKRADEVDAAWTAVMPVLQEWGSTFPGDFPDYPAGSWGPKAADELLARTGREWFPPIPQALLG
jgi:glucose-6-phosphate 1-dehydrogenase